LARDPAVAGLPALVTAVPVAGGHGPAGVMTTSGKRRRPGEETTDDGFRLVGTTSQWKKPVRLVQV
jgi:hypothetical protein